MIAVLAGSRREFDQFIRPWVKYADRNKFVYVGDVGDIMQRKFTNIIHIGTWYNKPDIYELERLCKLRLKEE